MDGPKPVHSNVCIILSPFSEQNNERSQPHFLYLLVPIYSPNSTAGSGTADTSAHREVLITRVVVVVMFMVIGQLTVHTSQTHHPSQPRPPHPFGRYTACAVVPPPPPNTHADQAAPSPTLGLFNPLKPKILYQIHVQQYGAPALLRSATFAFSCHTTLVVLSMLTVVLQVHPDHTMCGGR